MLKQAQILKKEVIVIYRSMDGDLTRAHTCNVGSLLDLDKRSIEPLRGASGQLTKKEGDKIRERIPSRAIYIRLENIRSILPIYWGKSHNGL